MTPIGRQIAEARHAKKMTQDEVAERMHISRQALSHWEQGRNQPDFESLSRLSAILECSFDLTAEEKTAAPSEPELRPEPEPAPAAPDRTKPSFRRNRLLLPAAFAAGLALLLMISFATRRRAVTASGGIARIAIESADPIPPTEDDAFVTGIGWIYALTFRETGGVSFTADTLTVEFWDDAGLIDSLSYEPAELWAGSAEIPAGGSRKLSGGVCLPGVKRMEVYLAGADANGNELSFSREIALGRIK